MPKPAMLMASSRGNCLYGRVYKGHRFWRTDIPSLNVLVQRLTKIDAFVMIKDLMIKDLLGILVTSPVVFG